MKYALAIPTALLLAPLAALHAADSKPTRSNILVIFADDLGYADLGASGSVEFLAR